jgi:hypothetical protein
MKKYGIQRGSVKEFFGNQPSLKLCLEFGEQAGVDTSGNGHHFTYHNGAAPFRASRHISSINLDGVDDQCMLQSPPAALKPATNITVMAWFDSAATPHPYAVAMVPRGAYSTGKGYALYGYATGGTSAFRIGDNSGSWRNTPNLYAPRRASLNFAAGSFDGANMRIFLNGATGTPLSIATTIDYTERANEGPNPTTLYIGGDHNQNNTAPTYLPDSKFYKGIIGNVAIFDRTLPQDEIADYYAWSIDTPARRAWYVPAGVYSAYYQNMLRRYAS